MPDHEAVRQQKSWLAATGVAYLGLIASMFTNVYHPFTLGTDRSVIFIVFVGAHLALGASWPTRWSFALPPLIGIVGVLVASDTGNGLAAFASILAVPTAWVLLALGRLIAWAARHVGTGRLAPIAAPVVLLIAAAVPLAEGARESWQVTTAPPLRAAEAQRLPLNEYTLNSLCGPELPARDRANLEAKGRALVQAIRRHGSSVITATYYATDENAGEHHELMTVRQLAQNQLGALRDFHDCEQPLQRALTSAIG